MAPKQRGRPRKNPAAEPKPPSSDEPKVPRKRGRPPKNKKKADQPAAAKPPAKKSKTDAAAGAEEAADDEDDDDEGEVIASATDHNEIGVTAHGTRNIIIERCTQCQCFKKSAMKVDTGLKDAIPDVQVTVNPEKPRKGCFEIRDSSGNIFLSLQNMPRPFTKLKQWDLDGTIAEIVEKIK